MGKLLQLKRRREVDTTAERQRQWLRTHPEVAVVGRWEWPRETWLQKRLGELRKRGQK